MENLSTEQLNAILQDPMSADFSDISKLMPEETPQASGSLDENTGASSDATAQQTSVKDEAPATDADIQPGAVIKTKDGKHEIPYAVLQKERERTKQLEAQLAEMSAKVANAAAEATGTQPDSTRDVAEIISADELAQLKEDAPTLAATFEKMIAQIDSLKATASRVEKNEQEQVQNVVQAAIDAHPKLAYVQASDPEKFSVIAEMDVWARTQPALKDLSLADRFAKVLSMYEVAHGAIELPASASGSKVVATDAKAKADAAIAKALAAAAPNTLTDIPGGNPPPANDIEAAAGMSAAALTAQFMNMTQAEMDKYLAKFA